MDITQYLAERKIQDAIQNGRFDNLEGFGQPIDNTEYFSVPEEDRIAFHILKNAGAVPEEILIRKDIYQLSLLIKKELDEDTRNAMKKEQGFLKDKLFVLQEKRHKSV
jgi:hypothetical protein